jgi:CRISPR-associated endonuclease/helicase Cas3
MGFPRLKEIAPAPAELARALRRVEVRWPKNLDVAETWRKLAPRVIAEPQALVIVHRKADARHFTEEVDGLAGGRAVHLSANMCPAHRADVLERIKLALRMEEPIRVVSTQVIEAGVDVDFPVVFRAMAGIDSLAQAAGRCNREGRRLSGRLEVFVAETDPPMGSPLRGFQVATAMLRADSALDIFDPIAHDAFFRRFYADIAIDPEGIQSKRAEGRFREVAESFRVIDDNAVGVVVPYGDADERIDALRRHGASRERLRALQRHVVSVPRRTFDALHSLGMFEEVAEAAYALTGAWRRSYDDRFGLIVDHDAQPDPLSFIA